MKYCLIAAVAIFVMFLGSCARARVYDDGGDAYRWHRHNFDHHYYQSDTRTY
ncbi:MAG: hypothetical protein H0X33_11845 [Taibaiella sp.]|nr:hypothetical protein [Taibaiella sp.]